MVNASSGPGASGGVSFRGSDRSALCRHQVERPATTARAAERRPQHSPLVAGLTTVYLGATDRRALDWLVAHGAEVRVSYDTCRTTAALHDGLEWNVRLSSHDNEGILAKFQAAFESYWEEGEFEPYRASELEQRRFDRAVREESAGESSAEATPLSFFDIRPYAYQQEILDKLSAERSASMAAGATWWWPPPARAKP